MCAEIVACLRVLNVALIRFLILFALREGVKLLKTGNCAWGTEGGDSIRESEIKSIRSSLSHAHRSFGGDDPSLHSHFTSSLDLTIPRHEFESCKSHVFFSSGCRI